MPNRIIKESIKRSPEIDALSWFEEVVFYRLIVSADDYGRLDGRPVVLKNDLFPTKETVTKKAIEDAIAHLASVGLLVPYVDRESGMPYLYLRKWEKHQVVRNKHSKFPAPTDNDLTANCKQLHADCKQVHATCMSESESNPNPNPIRIQSESSCAERPTVASTPPSGSGFVMTLNDGTGYDVPRGDIETYKRLYPAVDVESELRAMIGWCMSNPTKRKTRSGIARFINTWLKKEQDKGGSGGKSKAKPMPTAKDYGGNWEEVFGDVG